MVMDNAGFTGKVDATHFAFMFAGSNPVGDFVDGVAAWKVTQGTGRQVVVASNAGNAFAKAILSKNSTTEALALGTPTNGQWYLITRHLDWTGSGTVASAALAGPTTASTTVPAAPPSDYSGVPSYVATPGSAYDQPLAWAFVNSANTTVTIWDLRRVPGSVADLAELATQGGPEGDTKPVRELGCSFIRSGGIWVQQGVATFASGTARDTAFAKASAAYRVAGAMSRIPSVDRFDRRYNGSGWRPYGSADFPVMPTGITNLGGTGATLGPDGAITLNASTGVRILGIGSSDFDVIEIEGVLTATAAADLKAMVSAGGTDITTVSLYSYTVVFTEIASGPTRDAIATGNLGYVKAAQLIAGMVHFRLRIIGLNLAQNTLMDVQGGGNAGNARVGTGYVANTTQYTDFTLAPSSGSITGWLTVRGANKNA